MDREAMAERLAAILSARMPDGAQWMRDDGYQSNLWNPEQIAYAIAHLYLGGDVLSGTGPLATTPVPSVSDEGLDEYRLERAFKAVVERTPGVWVDYSRAANKGTITKSRKAFLRAVVREYAKEAQG